MKKAITMVLLAAMLLALCSCSSMFGGNNGGSSSAGNVQADPDPEPYEDEDEDSDLDEDEDSDERIEIDCPVADDDDYALFEQDNFLFYYPSDFVISNENSTVLFMVVATDGSRSNINVIKQEIPGFTPGMISFDDELGKQIVSMTGSQFNTELTYDGMDEVSFVNADGVVYKYHGEVQGVLVGWNQYVVVDGESLYYITFTAFDNDFSVFNNAGDYIYIK